MFTDKQIGAGRVVGVGVDIMHRNSIYAPYLRDGDPFLRATYSERERETAVKHRDPYAFYETRFCCKEAVFKTLGISGERVRFSEIEIESDENGRPTVTLLGALKRAAEAKGITEILISLTYDKDLAEAIAIAQNLNTGKEPNVLNDDIIKKLEQQARSNPQRIAFPESNNELIMQAAGEVVKRGIGTPHLLGRKEELEAFASSIGVSTQGFKFFDFNEDDAVRSLAAEYIKRFDDLSDKVVIRKAADPLNCAMFLLKLGLVDGVAAGREYTTVDVFIAARRIVGMKEGCSLVSALGIVNAPGFEGSEGSLLCISDPAINPSPDADELADIAMISAETAQNILGWEPRVAMLSFSTCGSAEHESIDVIRKAINIVRRRQPNLKIDGEFQLDAALLPETAQTKVKRESNVAGRANILIFPNLHAGNIGVKLIQVFGKADVYGPVLQGFAKPVCDFSRSAPLSEMMGNIIILIVRAQKER